MSEDCRETTDAATTEGQSTDRTVVPLPVSALLSEEPEGGGVLDVYNLDGSLKNDPTAGYNPQSGVLPAPPTEVQGFQAEPQAYPGRRTET